MKRTISLTIIVVAALAVQVLAAGTINTSARVRAGAGSPRSLAAEPQQQNEFRWHEPLAAGRVIEIRGVNGSVEAVPTSGSEVEVIAVKRARRSNPDDVRIEVVRHGDGVTICAVYPNVEGKEPNTCAPGGSGHVNVDNNDTSVNFTVRVPAGVRFSGNTVNGKVEANNLSADVDAKTVNGSITVTTTGLARAKTVNGSITVVMGRTDWADDLEFETVNGSIDLSFPGSLSAQVEAKTLNGEISTDFPMTVSGTFSKRRLTGTIGGGGRDLHLETVNGSVQIRRAS
ncbi:MAG: hypothetical protein QOJ70_1484 [Acidobacteriota bacterium]|jgi:hypothetical protein|nr:hypothetical protein [Acidobacteriota bacterium]